MKKYIGLSIIALGMGLTSCNDFLDKLPDNRTEANTEEKIQQLLVSAYPTSDHMAFTELASAPAVSSVPFTLTLSPSSSREKV